MSLRRNDEEVDWIFSEIEVEMILTREEGSFLKNDFEFRKLTINFIQEVGLKLKLFSKKKKKIKIKIHFRPHRVIATACIYFHRFYLLHLFREFDRFVKMKKKIFFNFKDCRRNLFVFIRKSSR